MRLNAFREERADSALRLAITEQTHAREQHTSATADIDRLGEWKTRGEVDAALDLTAYGAALELEQVAMARAETLQAQLQERERATRQATEALTSAACATRVSENRGKRESLHAESQREKRSFDQISDVWLNNREVARD
jgi:hypothetical protein